MLRILAPFADQLKASGINPEQVAVAELTEEAGRSILKIKMFPQIRHVEIDIKVVPTPPEAL